MYAVLIDDTFMLSYSYAVLIDNKREEESHLLSFDYSKAGNS